MLHVSLLIEALRARPVLLVVFAIAAQALLWTLVPTLFYTSPPDDLLEVLAIGREYQLGSVFGPPLAFWFADIAFTLGGLPGVYLFSQLCVAATSWIVFVLGRGIVGQRHAAMAVILGVGVFAFTMPTPDFGPKVLAMPLVALALLHYWRAVAQGRRGYWFVLAIELGLLLLTTYAGIILVLLLMIFTAATPRGRAALGTVDPWAATFVTAVVLFPHLVWLDQTRTVPLDGAFGVTTAALDDGMTVTLQLMAGVAAALSGVLIFAAVVAGIGAGKRDAGPTFERPPVDPFDRQFIYVFALAPMLWATVAALALGRPLPVGGLGPHAVLVSLAIVIAAGDTIRIYRASAVGVVWLGLLLTPALALAAAILLAPLTLAVDLKLGDPTLAMGHFFNESFTRRTGRPLAIVAGDTRLAELVALGAPDRPSVYLTADPARTPWIAEGDIKEKGAIIVWPAPATGNAPPTIIRMMFPTLVPEVPQTFERRIQGRLTSLRVGWAMIRPQASSAR